MEPKACEFGDIAPRGHTEERQRALQNNLTSILQKLHLVYENLHVFSDHFLISLVFYWYQGLGSLWSCVGGHAKHGEQVLGTQEAPGWWVCQHS